MTQSRRRIERPLDQQEAQRCMGFSVIRRPDKDSPTSGLCLILVAETIQQLDQRAQDLVRNDDVVELLPKHLDRRFGITLLGYCLYQAKARGKQARIYLERLA